MLVKICFGFCILVSGAIGLKYGDEDWKKTSERLGTLKMLNESYTVEVEDVRQLFLYGVKLHLLDMNDAAKHYFNMAKQRTNNYPMINWGLAMVSRVPSLNFKDSEKALNMLSEANISTITDLEKVHWQAAVRLFNESNREMGLIRYAETMSDVYGRYKHDQITTLMLAKAYVDLGHYSMEKLTKGSEILAEIISRDEKNTFAHYLNIIAYNLPKQFGNIPMALKSANKLSDIYKTTGKPVPYTIQLHQAYVFTKLGKWSDCYDTAKKAWPQGNQWANGNLTVDFGNRYLILEVLHYCAIQTGRFKSAKEYIDNVQKTVKDELDNYPEGQMMMRNFIYSVWYRMAARHILDTRNYELPSDVKIQLSNPPYMPLDHTPNDQSSLGYLSSVSEVAFQLAWYYYNTSNNPSQAESLYQSVNTRMGNILNLVESQKWPYSTAMCKVLYQQFLGMYHKYKGQVADSRDHFKKAGQEENMLIVCVHDPQLPFIPAWEMYADNLPKTGAERIFYFESMDRYAYRTASVYGLAIAYKSLTSAILYGSEKRKWYEVLNENWEDADTEFPARSEAMEDGDPNQDDWKLYLLIGISAAVLLLVIIATIVYACKVNKTEEERERKSRDEVDHRTTKYRTPYGFKEHTAFIEKAGKTTQPEPSDQQDSVIVSSQLSSEPSRDSHHVEKEIETPRTSHAYDNAVFEADKSDTYHNPTYEARNVVVEKSPLEESITVDVNAGHEIESFQESSGYTMGDTLPVHEKHGEESFHQGLEDSGVGSAQNDHGFDNVDVNYDTAVVAAFAATSYGDDHHDDTDHDDTDHDADEKPNELSASYVHATFDEGKDNEDEHAASDEGRGHDDEHAFDEGSGNENKHGTYKEAGGNEFTEVHKHNAWNSIMGEMQANKQPSEPDSNADEEEVDDSNADEEEVDSDSAMNEILGVGGTASSHGEEDHRESVGYQYGAGYSYGDTLHDEEDGSEVNFPTIPDTINTPNQDEVSDKEEDSFHHPATPPPPSPPPPPSFAPPPPPPPPSETPSGEKEVFYLRFDS